MISFQRLIVPALLVTLSGVASAQSSRTWISGVGDDANPCSRTAPCKTFAGAISKTTAGGEIDALDPSGFGTVTITKSITLDGGGFVSSILASGTNGVNIVASPTDSITLRNLTINGTGSSLGVNGVNTQAAGAVHLENVVIQNFAQSGVLIAPSGSTSVTMNQVLIRDISGAGLLVIGAGSSSTSQVAVKDSSFLNCGTGVNAGPNTKVVVQNSSASTNVGAGFVVTGNGMLSVVNSTASGNGGAAFRADSGGGTPTLSLAGSTAASNTGPGVQTTGTGTSVLRMTGSALLGNGGGITGSGTTYFGTYGDNEITNGVTGVTTLAGTKQ